MTQNLPEFREYLVKTRGAAESTVGCYLRDAEKFNLFLRNNPSANAQDFISDLVRLGTPASSISRYISSLKCYFDFLVLREYKSDNPFSEMTAPKVIREPPEILSVAQVEALLAQPDVTTADGMRDRVALELAYQTGLMTGALLALNVDNVNLQLNVILMKSDGKERIVPIAGILTNLIGEYIAKTRVSILKGKNERALLINMRGGRLTRQSLWRIAENYGAAAGIKQRVTPQTLRMSLCAHMIESGADIKDIRDVHGLTDSSAASLYSVVMQIKYGQARFRVHPQAEEIN